jgi:hypothetical protein
MAGTPFDNSKRLDEEYVNSTVRMVLESIRQGKPLPDFARYRRDFYQYAKTEKGFSDKGSKAWANVTVEEFRRNVAKVLAMSGVRLR